MMTQPGTPERVHRSRWRKRLLLAALAPVLVLALLEGGLRVAGIGYPASFLVSEVRENQSFWIPNPRFTWRFFGPERARRVDAFALAKPKPADTIRIFVMGESAAQGDPDPEFGLARMLQALLELRFPTAHFEVVNTAITGINSHTILPLARDCADAEGDIWVLYIGNNEVVGPFGAGTIFGPQAPPLPVIRASLALKSTRLGQELDALRRRFRPLPPDKQVWGGMLMFAENQVPSGDPRLDAVYHHFEQNLSDILDVARARGVGVVASTVAVNLLDGAPFVSVHQDGLGEPMLALWESLVQQGEEALAGGAPAAALTHFQQAAAIDDAPAVLHYLLGQALLAQGNAAQAYQALARARDEDALRFRCDSRLNDVTRRLAGERDRDGVVLVDAEREVAAQSSRGAPGFDYFYDHVHLTFAGNHRLATSIAREIAPMLPEAVRAAGAADWSSVEACAERLAWTPMAENRALSSMLGRYREPPFTFQRDHEKQMGWLRARVVALGAAATDPRRLANACQRALARAPQDGVIHRMHAEALRGLGELAGAEQAAQRAVEAMPFDRGSRLLLCSIQIDRGETDAALATLRRDDSLDPDDGLPDHFRGLALALAGQTAEAEPAFRRAIEVNPRQGSFYLDLARLLDAEGRTGEADDCVRQALTNRILTVEFLSQLAGACMQRKWFAEARTSLDTAIELSPADPSLQLHAGRCADAMGDTAGARRRFQQAVELAPDRGEAHYLLGVSYGRGGHTTGALRHFEQAARLMPDLPEAHLNLARAQIQAGQPDAAARSLQQVLRIQPDHAEARRRLAELQPALGE